MEALTWALFFVCFCCKVTQTEASSWSVTVPSSVEGLLGSCVVIPCAFTYPNAERQITGFAGMWIDGAHQLIYHPNESKMMQQFRSRTQLLGDVKQKDCTLKIDPLYHTDGGPFYFRIELGDYEKYSYMQNPVSIEIKAQPKPITFSVKEEVVEGQSVTASCSVLHFCSSSPPVFTWSHPGQQYFQQQQLDASQWKATSTLTFHPTSADHNKPLECALMYKGGQHHKASKVLKVKHAPVNVKVEHKSDVKEGETVRLKCSCDAHPPASSYLWHNETGAQLHQGSVYLLSNVSRHTGALYCTAVNAAGRNKSSPVQLNVLYAPEIKAASSCTSEADVVKCVCIAESKPPSMVHFLLSDKVLLSTRVEKHGSLTIGTLQAELGSSKAVYCLANNTQGNASLTLFLPVNSKMQNLYIIIAVAVAGGTLVMLLITMKVVKNCRGRSEVAAAPPVSSVKADKDLALPQYAVTKRKEKSYDDAHCSELYGNDHVYGNMEADWDDAIYANV